MSKIATVVLAAGASSRFGRCKLLLPLGDRSLLQNRVDAVIAAGVGSPIIISGAWHSEVQKNHAHLDLRFHSDWRQGIGSSIAFAVEQLPGDTDAVLFLLADQVGVTAADLQQLKKTWQSKKGITSAIYCSQTGVPAIFPRALFNELRQLSGDSGAKKLLKKHSGDVTSLPMASAAIDIDTNEDWNNWLAHGEEAWS